MFIRRAAATLLFIFALIFALIFFLLNGIKINSFSFGQIYISQLYIKLDKKLIVNIEQMKLNNDSKVQNSYEDLEKNIKKIPFVLSFFDKIDIDSLIIDGNTFSVLLDKDHLYLDNKFVNISSKYNKIGDTVTFDLYSLLLKDINLFLQGSIHIDYDNDKASFYGNYLLNNKITGELNTQFSKKNIDFFVTTQQIKNIKFLKKFFRLDKIAESWMYDRVVGDMKLNYLYGQFDPKTLQPVLNSIKGEAVISNASITFNKKVSPIKTSKLLLTYEKDNLHFNLHQPTYKKLSIDGSDVNIVNLSSEQKGHVDVSIKTKEVLGNDILDILNAYGLSLPIKQISGKTTASILLKIPYIKPLETFGDFRLKNSELLINNNFSFYTKDANVELKNSKVIVKSSHFKHKDLVDATIDLVIDIDKLKAKGNALINDFVIANHGLEVINLNKLKTPMTLDFNNNTIIGIQKIETNVVLNKEKTIVNIDNLQSIKKYSKILMDNHLTHGKLNLSIVDENNIEFEGIITQLDLPIKRGEEKLDSLEFFGALKNENVSISSKENDIFIDINKGEELKITLKDLNIFPEMNTKETFDSKLNLRLINSVVFEKDATLYPKDLEVTLFKDHVTFDGVMQNLEMPILDKGKKVTQLDLTGKVIGNKLEVESKDKRLYFQLLDDNDYFVKLNGLDLQYNTTDENDATKSIHVIGKDSAIVINGKYRTLASEYDFRTNERISRFELSHNQTQMNYLKDTEGLITLKATNISDVFINNFFQKDFVSGGTLDVEATGKDHILTGRISFKENKLKNLRTLNNIIVLVTTSPGLVNPFLAIPSIFGMVTSDGFNLNGYKVNDGYVDFTYNSQMKFLNMYAINTVGNSVDFDGYATFDFAQDIVHSDMKLIFMKGYTSVIDAIPGLDYILLGDDKIISTQINITGSIEEPDIQTNIIKDSASAPFELIKRIFMLPLKPFLD